MPRVARNSAKLALVLAAAATSATSQSLDWTGIYAGVQGANIGGDWDEFDTVGAETGSISYTIDGSALGAFAGYQIQNGTLVYGVEVSALFGEVESTSWSSDDYDSVYDVQLRQILDLKARVGMPVDQYMPYAFVGVSSVTLGYGLDGDWGPKDYSTSGYNAGAGIDFRIGDNGFVGIEYIYRHIESDISGLAEWSVDAGLSGVQLRGGFTF